MTSERIGPNRNPIHHVDIRALGVQIAWVLCPAVNFDAPPRPGLSGVDEVRVHLPLEKRHEGSNQRPIPEPKS